MVHRKRFFTFPLAFVSAAIVLAGCGSGITTTTTTTQAPAPAAIIFGQGNTASAGCSPDTSPPPAVQLTMVYKEVQYGALPDGSKLHCLDGPPISGLLGWSADGTAYIFGGTSPQVSVETGQSEGFSFSGSVGAFTRPKAVGVYVSDPNMGIVRYSLVAGQQTPVTIDSNLQGTIAVSPDGSHLAVSAESKVGVASSDVWIMNKNGADSRKLVSVPAKTIPNGSAFAQLFDLTFLSENQLAYMESSPGLASGPFSLHILNISTDANVVAAIIGSSQDTEGLVPLVPDSNVVATVSGSCSTHLTPMIIDLSAPGHHPSP
jgi:hypothetical protein